MEKILLSPVLWNLIISTGNHLSHQNSQICHIIIFILKLWLKIRLYFSIEKSKVEVSYVANTQSSKEMLSYSKLLILTSSSSHWCNCFNSTWTAFSILWLKTFRQSLLGKKDELHFCTTILCLIYLWLLLLLSANYFCF